MIKEDSLPAELSFEVPEVQSSSTASEGAKSIDSSLDIQANIPLNSKRKHVQIEVSREPLENSSSVLFESDDHSKLTIDQCGRKKLKSSPSKSSFTNFSKNYKKYVIFLTKIVLDEVDPEQDSEQLSYSEIRVLEQNQASLLTSSDSPLRLDMPERFQESFSKQFEKEMTDEVWNYVIDWIYSQISGQKASKQVIKDVLHLVLYEKVEIPAICNNEKNFISTTEQSTLWEIFNLFQAFRSDIHYPRMRQEDLTIEMYSIKPLSDSVIVFMEKASTVKQFFDIQLYLDYQKSCHDIKTRTDTEFKLLSEYLPIINKARDQQISKRVFAVFEDSSLLAETIRNPAAFLSRSQYALPNSEEEILTTIFKRSLNSPSEKATLLELIQDYNATLSTSPKSNGKPFTIFDEFFPVKKINKRPVNQISNEDYILIKQAVMHNLVECQIQLSWVQNEEQDQILQHFLPNFQPHLQSISPEMKNFTKSLLSKLLRKFVYPLAQVETVRMLEEKTGKYIMDVCVKKFREFISYGFHKTVNQSTNKLVDAETVLSLYVNADTGVIGVVTITNQGKEVYRNSLEYYFNVQQQFQEKREFDRKNLFEYIQNRSPNVIAISNNSPRSLTLSQDIQSNFKNKSKSIVFVDQKMMGCFKSQSDNILSIKDKMIFLATKQAKTVFSTFQEVSLLWASNHESILSIEFHPFQKKIDQKQLLIRFQQSLMERVCLEGVDFKLFHKDKQIFQALVSLLPGFGPQKAKQFVVELSSLPNSKDLNSREKLCDLKLLPENLQRNALCFIKFTSSQDPIDSTKLAFAQYFIVQELAERTFKKNHDGLSPDSKQLEEEKKRILSAPSLLSQLNLREYANELDHRFKKKNMILQLDHVIDCMRQSANSNANELPTNPCVSLPRVFETVYKIKQVKVQPGSVLRFLFKEESEKYYEFTSRDYKFRARLYKNEVPKSVNISRWIELKKSTVVDLIIESVKCLEGKLEGQTPTEILFENSLQLKVPNYLSIAKTIHPNLVDSEFFLPFDQSDFPAVTESDLHNQFNVFQREMTQNPMNVIDLTEDNPFNKFETTKKSLNQNNFSTSAQWGDQSTSVNNSGSSWEDCKPLRMQSNDRAQKPVETWAQTSMSNSNGSNGPWSSGNTNIKAQQSEASSLSWGNESSKKESNNISDWGQSASSNSVVSNSWNSASSSNATSGDWGGKQQESGNQWGGSSSSNQFEQQSSNNQWGSSSASSMGSASWNFGSSETNGNSESGSENRRSWGGGGAGGAGAAKGGPRSCFKCKKEGHMSRECPEAGSADNNRQVCFNCKQEGHMSRSCPNQQQKSSSCFKCGQEGHQSRECPNNQQSNRPQGGSKECFKCKQEGHMSRECPNQTQQGNTAKKSCFKCGEEGHVSRECPKQANNSEGRSSSNFGGSKECFKCKQEGHFSRDCPNQQGPQKCFKCDQEGHMSRECPNPSNQSRPQQKRSCFNCGDESHTSRDCQMERKERPQSNNFRKPRGFPQNNEAPSGGGGGGWNSGASDWGQPSSSSSSGQTSGWGQSSNEAAASTAPTSSNSWGSSSNNNNNNNLKGQQQQQQQEQSSWNSSGSSGSGGWANNQTQTNSDNSGGWGSTSTNAAKSTSGGGGWGCSSTVQKNNSDIPQVWGDPNQKTEKSFNNSDQNQWNQSANRTFDTSHQPSSSSAW